MTTLQSFSNMHGLLAARTLASPSIQCRCSPANDERRVSRGVAEAPFAPQLLVPAAFAWPDMGAEPDPR